MSVSNGHNGNGAVKTAERGGGAGAAGAKALKLTAKDFKSDQEIRWCPGCGDYAILSATQQGRPLGVLGSMVAGMALATPVIISGPLLIYLFAIWLDWLPATGQGDLPSLILPALVLGISASGGIARVVNAGLRDALAQPFTTTARAKGLSARQVLNRHALPVALMPALTVMALQFGFQHRPPGFHRDLAPHLLEPHA